MSSPIKLGIVFQSRGNYDKAQDYYKKALAIRLEIAHREGEAADDGNLGRLFDLLGEHDKAQEHLEKALRISKEICNRNGETSCYTNLEAFFCYSKYTLEQINI